jgi:hypothetical protein
MDAVPADREQSLPPLSCLTVPIGYLLVAAATDFMLPMAELVGDKGGK